MDVGATYPDSSCGYGILENCANWGTAVGCGPEGSGFAHLENWKSEKLANLRTTCQQPVTESTMELEIETAGGTRLWRRHCWQDGAEEMRIRPRS